MTAVTFPNGNSYSDDGTTAHDMRNGGHRANLLPMIGDTIDVAQDAIGAAAAAVPAATTATAAATTATTQAAIATAAANTAAGIVQHTQPSEIAGIPPIIDFPFSGPAAVPSGVITGSSGKWVFNQAGVLTLVPAGTAPIDFDPVTSALRGLLVEESRTNLLTYSQQFDNAAWVKIGSTVTADAVAAPDGTVTADKIVEDASTGNHAIYRTGSSTATQWAASYFAKAGERSRITITTYNNASGSPGASALFDLSSGTVVSSSAVGGAGSPAATITSMGSGWYRCVVIPAAVTAGTTINSTCYITSSSSTSYVGASGSGVYLWGAQLEAGAFATSYIPTTSSTVTRSADVNTLSLASVPGWNSSEGTIYVEARTALGSGTQTYAQYDDGTNNNRIAVYRDSSNVLRCIVVVSGSTVVNLSLGTVAADTAFKVAFDWKANSFAASLNGGAVVTSSSGAIPSGLTTHRIGHDSSGNHANGPIRRDTLLPRRVADVTIPLLSA